MYTNHYLDIAYSYYKYIAIDNLLAKIICIIQYFIGKGYFAWMSNSNKSQSKKLKEI